MTQLHERAFVQTPYGRAPQDLKTYLESLGWRSGAPATLTMRFEPSDLGLPGIPLARDVNARFEATEDPTHLTKPLKVTWSPAGGGPFPTFNGTLTISEDEDYGSCILTLSGEYEPPLGLVGKGFDAVIGFRIAIATARRLLESIRDGMEAAQTTA
ncbi:MAG: hypothetical protein JO347_11530 [Candidatus Eremiobacteraeota bacterium]|nr:hypothetical protein [Candidatus Eremiobacteraeota bacterium]MBV8282674.1 hypothetical protein [Candidatus Eremiobacteraeota bacterium]